MACRQCSRGDRPRGGRQGRGSRMPSAWRGWCGGERRPALERAPTTLTSAGCGRGHRNPVPGEVGHSPGGCPWSARPAIAARSPPRPGSVGSSRSSCAGSSPTSPSGPAAHPLGLADPLRSCGSSCRVTTSWFRDDLGAARFLPPVRRPPSRTHSQTRATAAPNALRSSPAPFKVAFQKIHP